MSELKRQRAEVPDLTDHPGGLEEFAPRERRIKDVAGVPDFIKPGQWATSGGGSKLPVFKVTNDDEEVLIKFIEEGPFAPLYQHWIQVDGKRRAYICIVNDCPLCARGDKPKASNWFNVINMSLEEPALQIWYASPDPSKAIKARADNKRTSPINKKGLYFVVSKATGKNGVAEYSLDPVKADELSDWGAADLTDEQIAAFAAQKYDATLVQVPTKTELEAVATQYLED